VLHERVDKTHRFSTLAQQTPSTESNLIKLL
jgi:hypothetical protein